MSEKVSFNMRIEDDLLESVKEKARSQGITTSDGVRDALVAWLGRDLPDRARLSAPRRGEVIDQVARLLDQIL